VLSHAPSEVVTVSAELRHHLVAEGFDARQVNVIYNGIDIGPMPTVDARRRIRTELAIPDDALVIGTIARLDPVKDLGTLLHAMAQDQSGRQLLLVIGDGAERRRLEHDARGLGVGSSVRFLGHRDDARELLSACDVYANSSISEGISLTILEAMAAGLPVVATEVGGTPEIVDASTGRLVPARDPRGLAAALAAIAADESLRRTLGRHARARVEERFTLDRMVREYRDAYYTVAA
jgi:glycosyltransferase involved in cell wall biosynthesis